MERKEKSKTKTAKTAPAKPSASPIRYHQARGGRKTATALARVYEKNLGITINGKDVLEYFKTPRNQQRAKQPFKVLQLEDQVGASVHVSGGGINAQADAVANAIARAIVKWKEENKKKLRLAGLITRDSRMVERKKYGHHKARKSHQWSKR